MRIVKLKGGLGNQMFQYAYAKLIEKITGDDVRLDFSAYKSLKGDTIRVPRLTKFNISLKAADDTEINSVLKLKHKGNSLSFWYKVGIFAEKTINKNYAFEPNRAFIEPEQIKNKLYFDGYWQSYKYTDQVLDILLNEFTPNYEMSENTKLTASKMQNENSVFIGVRKGDYAESNYDFRHFGVFGEKYYIDAIEELERYVGNPVYYIFSNDIPWCKENIHWGNREIHYREPEVQTNDFEEFMLMSSCKNAIIVNSTYHWWAANLIKNPNKIVCCPHKWFFDGAPIDVIPDKWHKIVANMEK